MRGFHPRHVPNHDLESLLADLLVNATPSSPTQEESPLQAQRLVHHELGTRYSV